MPNPKPSPDIIPEESISSKIYFIRGQNVMLDRDLSVIYGVQTRVLNQAVRRNIERLPDDFMFQLNKDELDNLISQIVTSSWGGQRKLPFAFTEQGVSMLSGVLNSSIAIQVHIRIIRVFTRMRATLLTNKDILLRLEVLEKDGKENKQDIELIFEALKQLVQKPEVPRTRIGFKPGDDY